MSAGFARLEALVYQHRFALLWISYVAACVTLLVRILAEPRGLGYYPYPIRELMMSNADGLVRRGLAGDIILWASGQFGGALWVWAYALSCAGAFCLFVMALRLYRRLPDDPAHLPMLLAPWGLAFFAYDPGGSFRKEILGVIALLLILRGCFAVTPVRARMWAIGGAVVFLVALFVHEGIAIMAPMFLLACALLVWRFPTLMRFSIGLALGAGVLSLAVVVGFTLLPYRDPAVLCAAVGDPICGDPYAWVAKGFRDGVAYMLDRRVNEDLPLFAAFIALATWPFLGLRVQGWSRGRHWLVFAVCCASVAPLFISAFDWGRWIHMVALPLSCVGLAAVALGKARYVRVMPFWAVVIYIGSHALLHAERKLLLTPLLLWPTLLAVACLSLAVKKLRAK